MGRRRELKVTIRTDDKGRPVDIEAFARTYMGLIIREDQERQMAESRYYPNCPVCGKPATVTDDVMPWGKIPGDPRPCIAHTRCVAEKRKPAT